MTIELTREVSSRLETDHFGWLTTRNQPRVTLTADPLPRPRTVRRRSARSCRAGWVISVGDRFGVDVEHQGADGNRLR